MLQRSPVVGWFVLWREIYHRAILDFCNTIGHKADKPRAPAYLSAVGAKRTCAVASLLAARHPREDAVQALTLCAAVCYRCYQSYAKGGLCHDTLGDTRDWIFGFLLMSYDQSGAGPIRRGLDHALRRQEP